MPTVPSGVQVRGGLYFGTTMAHLGSRGQKNPPPGQKPFPLLYHSVPQTIRFISSTETPLQMRHVFNVVAVDYVGGSRPHFFQVLRHRFLRFTVFKSNGQRDDARVEYDIFDMRQLLLRFLDLRRSNPWRTGSPDRNETCSFGFPARFQTTL